MNVLIIDDERSIRLSLSIGLRDLSDRIFEAEDGETGIEIYKNQKIDLVILDINLPGINGLDVLKQLKVINKDCLVIMITFLAEVKLAVKAMKQGAYDYFTKPFSVNDIIESIKNVSEFIQKREEVNSKAQLDTVTMIGESTNIRTIKEQITRLGMLNHDTCILIQGESGCGKEIVAKEIHNAKGKELPFVDLNCAAIPKGLQESELFGYEKGAYSDAKTQKKGLIENANGGLLFLDEIGDMDLELQAKLLRVLQEKKFRRIGGREDLHFSATIIAATNKDLKACVEEGSFRLDLFYRLNVIPMTLKPLRERKEDIILLVDYFIDFYNDKLNRQIRIEDKQVYDLLKKYHWPGNIRELKNLIERIMILSNEPVITMEQLPSEIIEETIKHDVLMSLEENEKEVIYKRLEECQWNITQTAKKLGVSRLTLRRKIEKYDLEK